MITTLFSKYTLKENFLIIYVLNLIFVINQVPTAMIRQFVAKHTCQFARFIEGECFSNSIIL